MINIEDEKLIVDSVIVPIPNLHFLEEIGGGANARVFLVYNDFLYRKEAVKIWKPKEDRCSVNEKQFRAEVQKNAAARFPNVASFFDAGVLNGVCFARLEYIEGTTLRKFLHEAQSFAIRFKILETIVNTMILVYNNGYYHGDLHDRNVLVNDYQPWIIDFGTSALSGEDSSHQRDCTLFIDLCFEVLPELENLRFIEKSVLLAQGSLTSANLMQRCLSICWDLETTTDDLRDETFIKQECFSLQILESDFDFLDTQRISEFKSDFFSGREIHEL